MSGTEAQIVVPQEKPLYPDVPWWAVLVTALVCSIAAVVATAVAMRSGVTASVPGAPASVAALALDTMVYMPHVILLFGVLADMFTYDGVWSIPSLLGVMSIFINFVFRYFWVGLEELWKSGAVVASKAVTGSAPATRANVASGAAAPLVSGIKGGAKGSYFKDYDGCSVQGFESFASEYAPQTLVVTATVFSYYCLDLIQNRGWVNSIAAIGAFLLTYGGQVAALASLNDGGCPPVPGQPARSTMTQAVRALFEGLLFGGTSYGIVKTYYPTRLPSSTVSPFPRRSGGDLTMGADGKMRDADGFPYVVLPNGQAVPDFGDAESRKAFGKLASTTLGTGVPATAGCDADSGGTTDDRLARIGAIAGAV